MKNPFRFFRLSETALSILWLWHNDPDGWVWGDCSVAHPASGIGVWTANGTFSMNLYYDCGVSAEGGYILHGREVELSLRDRRALFRAIRRQPVSGELAPIPQAVARWAMTHDVKIPESV